MLGPALPRGGPLLALLLLASVSGATAQGLSAGTPIVRREVRIGVPGIPAALDPASALEGATPLIARQVFDTLVAYRQGSTDVEPALATRWTASRDGLVWSFTLRDNVKFHDGTPLTSAEVVASFDRQLHQDATAATSAWSALFRGAPGIVRHVRAPDRRTVEIVLAQPYAPLLTVLAHPALAVARVTSAAGRLVGTGPYRVVDATTGRLALEAAPGYWAGPPRSERLVVLDVETDEQAEAELDAKALDVWFPATPPRRAEGALSLPGLRVGYLVFQTERAPFSKKKVRQAIAAALDPAVIGVALDRAAVPLQSFLPPGVWARREGSPILGGSHAAVRSLLAPGGMATRLNPTLLVSSQTGLVNLPKLAEVLQLALSAAGIPVSVKTEAPDALPAILQKGEHDFALVEALGTAGDPDFFLFPLSTSEGATQGHRALTFAFYRNPKLDGMLIRASQLSVRSERQRLYQRAQALLAAELPWLPIYVGLNWAVARAEVRGLRLHPTGFHRLDTVTLDVAPDGPR